MRARGAEATDIVVLVVAADDGVMPQTVEAIDHAKAADVPIVVAINKIDRENADPNRVMQQLSEHGLVPEAWGGDTIMVRDLGPAGHRHRRPAREPAGRRRARGAPGQRRGPGPGVVLEANLDVGRGPVATVLVQQGTLRGRRPGRRRCGLGPGPGAHRRQGRAGQGSRSVDAGRRCSASPTSPSAGDDFGVAPDERKARTVAETRERWQREAARRPRRRASCRGGARLEDIFEQIQRGETATLNLVLKADVQGSLEAVTESLRKLERDEVKLGFVHRGVGGITENDIQLAAASNATIIGFNVRPDRKARELADDEDVEIRTYEIIYKLLEDIEAAMVGMLAPEFEEVVTGEAEVREIFRVPAGRRDRRLLRASTASITRGSKVRFLREGAIIWKGAITSLRRFKDDVREVAAGFECGIGLIGLPGPQAGRHHRDLRGAGDPRI